MRTLYIVWLKSCCSEDSIDSYWLNKNSMNKYLKENARKWSAVYGEGRYYIKEEEVYE